MPTGAEDRPLLTIGHSNHPTGHFLALLARHRVEVVADVRSRPYSRFVPQYRKQALTDILADGRVEPQSETERRLMARTEAPLLASAADPRAEPDALQREYDRWWHQSR